MKSSIVSIAPFLSACSPVITLGVRSSLADYSPDERRLMWNARTILFPTPRFAGIFQAIGKATLPNAMTYRHWRSRVDQEILFQYLGLPHPRTRLYFGKRQKLRIPGDYSVPFLAMGPEAHGHTLHKVSSLEELAFILRKYNPLIIQEYMDWTVRIRVLCILDQCLAFQKLGPGQSLEPAVERWEPIPAEADEAVVVKRLTCRFLHSVDVNAVVIEWGLSEGTWHIIRMIRPAPAWKTPTGEIRYHRCICSLAQAGCL